MVNRPALFALWLVGSDPGESDASKPSGDPRRNWRMSSSGCVGLQRTAAGR